MFVGPCSPGNLQSQSALVKMIADAIEGMAGIRKEMQALKAPTQGDVQGCLRRATWQKSLACFS